MKSVLRGSNCGPVGGTESGNTAGGRESDTASGRGGRESDKVAVAKASSLEERASDDEVDRCRGSEQ